jgi:hypothetical protein
MWTVRSVPETIAVWIIDPLRGGCVWLHLLWTRRVVLPVTTRIARSLAHLAFRLAPEAVLAQERQSENTALSVSSEVAATPGQYIDVPSLSAVAQALGHDPDPLLPDFAMLTRHLANALHELETRQPGWPGNLSSDLAQAVMCWPQRVDDRLQEWLDEAAANHQPHRQPPHQPGHNSPQRRGDLPPLPPLPPWQQPLPPASDVA